MYLPLFPMWVIFSSLGTGFKITSILTSNFYRKLLKYNSNPIKIKYDLEYKMKIQLKWYMKWKLKLLKPVHLESQLCSVLNILLFSLVLCPQIMPNQFFILKIHLLVCKLESIKTEYLLYDTTQCHPGHKMAGSVKEWI